MKNNDVETLILRFRDLVTPRGDTIKKHKEKCDEKGSVWWGWWSKAGETIPDNTFRILKKKATSDKKLTVYLLDSGQRKLFEAQCLDIHWEIDHKVCGAPEKEKDNTPKYYIDQEYLAWFNFSDISTGPCDERVLKNFTYIGVDDFFEDYSSKYTAFYNKRIDSIDELIQQNRSIWFIRGFKKGDLTHVIKLFDRRETEPAHFIDEYLQPISRNLLWVSDLHYSYSNDHYGFSIDCQDVVKESIELRIEHALNKNGIKDIGGVIISGDITWKASKEEFELANSFTSWAKRWGKLGNYQFAICPGNHDIAFSADPSKKKAKITKAPDEARAQFEDFYKELFYMKPNEYISSGRRFLLGNAVPVEIVCLNSSYLTQHEDFYQGHGFLGRKQLDDAAERMGWQSNVDPLVFRIVVLHHHLLPVTFREIPVADRQYSVVLDAEALSRWIVEYRVRLVLHGHMHNPFMSRVSRPISIKHPDKEWFEYYVLGMGSTGAAKDHLGEIGHNTIGILKFKKHNVEIKYYTIHPINEAIEHCSIEIPYENGGKLK
jgi:predicted phosphodiesterase